MTPNSMGKLRTQSDASKEEDARAVAEILASREFEQVERGYRQLMDKYWTLVALFVRAQVGDHQEAEDITQEAFLRGFRSLKSLKQPRAFLGWLLRIAKNAATDHLRNRKAMHSLDVLQEAGRAAELLTVGDELPDHAGKLELSEQVEQVLKAVNSLPGKYREVVTLKYLQDLDGRTMAEILGEPEGTVRNRLFRALEKLRVCLRAIKSGENPQSAHKR